MRETGSRGFLSCLIFASMIVGTGITFPDRAFAALGDCSQPVTNGSAPVATDCLFILTVAVGLDACDPQCICSPTGSSTTVAADALACLIKAAGEAVVLDCPCGTVTTTTAPSTTTSTTTTLAVSSDCPDTLTATTFARIGRSCDDDADCPAGTCDHALARCRTATELDFGWSGLGHDMDIHDSETLLLRLACGEKPPCGVCSIEGIDPANRLCRCAGDNRAICDEPFVADQDDCGGDICTCYQGPPLPVSAGNTPACFIQRLASDISGTVDVDGGALAIHSPLITQYYVGDSLIWPCSYCANDTVIADGIRDGVCVVGRNAGMDCDVDATNTTFPAPGGDGHSLDCFPDVGKNKSGAGLLTNYSLSTGAASLSANVDCSFFGLPFSCHCGVCSSNSGLACQSNADCEMAAAGTCGKRGTFDPKPNGCAGAMQCTAATDGDATCDEGPLDAYCDGLVRSDGRGFIQCLTNADCDPSVIGVNAGECALTHPRECFLPTIEAQGVPDPDTPVAAALYCAGPSSGAGFNAAWGIVGPARLVTQLQTRKLCGGSLGAPYVSGVGCRASTQQYRTIASFPR